ncbi:carboxylesterase family protein [Sandaracinomonas limnophila]|uniref:Carboxylic ester hydrolase n=1 Tax=Sandaracinomonas limnophila TaxID=1862386 RepID=A0A437PUS1_9BACT|nr:carboxylesterase family protein [Sandaracinomonas limnophila]RVU25977.1 carboxylesterase family protein [Sandaracinomonas limnophila]
MKRLLTITFYLLPFTFLFAQSIVVKTDKGKVKGFTKDNLQIFLGIPFAKPPVGDLRWKAPQAMDPWKGIKECTQFSASPFQNAPAPFAFWSSEFLIPKSPISEDCLYLNVWTKAKVQKPKAVLVYIYGGGFRSGGTACPIYDGSNMAKEDVVFVSLNYRVGVFGFMAHPELSKESSSASSGNYAILDLIEGLKWVKNNIHAFGGDPNQVTIAGQSAGASAVSILCASPLAKGLFKNAVLESGALSLVMSNPAQANEAKEKAEAAGLKLAERLGVASLAELRNKSAEEIQKTNLGQAGPYADGYIIPVDITGAYLAGKQNDVNLLIGWNKDDRLSPRALPADKYIEQIKTRFKDKADEVLQLYPATTDAIASESQTAMSRNEFFGSKQYGLAKLQEAKGKGKIYMYRFCRDVPGFTPETQFGAFHTGDVPYFYNNLHTVNRPFEAADQQLAKSMSQYLLNFTKTGNPSGKGLTTWPAYDQKDKKIMVLDKQLEVVRLPDEKQVEYFNK